MPIVPIRIERTHTQGQGPTITAWAQIDPQGAVTSGLVVDSRQLTSAQVRQLTQLLNRAADSADELGAKASALFAS